MDFFAQIGVALVILLILCIIIKSNKSLEKAYTASQEIKENGIKREEIKEKSKVERSSDTVASDLVIEQERRKNNKVDFYIWTIDAGGRLEDKIEVDKYPFTIGRAEDNDFWIDDNSVSSHHAQIRKEGETIILKDMNSLNKIFVNGRQTLEVRVRDGLCVFLGNTELYFEENK